MEFLFIAHMNFNLNPCITSFKWNILTFLLIIVNVVEREIVATYASYRLFLALLLFLHKFWTTFKIINLFRSVFPLYFLIKKNTPWKNSIEWYFPTFGNLSCVCIFYSFIYLFLSFALAHILSSSVNEKKELLCIILSPLNYQNIVEYFCYVWSHPGLSNCFLTPRNSYIWF